MSDSYRIWTPPSGPLWTEIKFYRYRFLCWLATSLQYDIAGVHKFYTNYRSHWSFPGSSVTCSKFPADGPQMLVAPVLCTLDISLSIEVSQSKESRLYMKFIKSMLCRQTVCDYCHNQRKRIITLHQKTECSIVRTATIRRSGHSGFESR